MPATDEASLPADRAAALEGVWNIVPTPFTDDGALDIASLGTLTDFVIARGVQGMTILGVLGEATRLTDEERRVVIATVVERAAGRIPICVGASAPGTDRAIGYAREAIDLGAHSVMLAPPTLARPNDAAVRAHYLAVAAATDRPIVVQDHPASSGVWMSVELLLDLAASDPRLRVIKLEDDPTPPKAGRLLAADPSLRVLGGLGGRMLIEELRRGCVGTMTGFGYPEILVDIVSRYRSGDHEGATLAFLRACPLIRFEDQAGINLPLRKRIYQRRGAIASARVRAPAPTLDAATIADLDDLLRRLDLLDT
ncbi:MAG: dihydrodipicolinate synthase family protein [Chloroflexi bacterium]|nr:dihydrodipicolinate synthase family protein [Chloroflexota bacterium]